MLVARRAFALGLAAAWVTRGPRASAEEPAIGTFPLAVGFAVEAGERVQDRAWLDAQLAEAARLYGPLGVQFRVTTDRALTSPRARLETRGDRDALAAECAPKVINVFVVASLRDVDDGVTFRRGVHWRRGPAPGPRYIILSAIAGSSVLAHELGHYFGNGHSTVTDNLMSYDRTGGPVSLDARQAATIRASARLAVRSGEVALVPDVTR